MNEILTKMLSIQTISFAFWLIVLVLWVCLKLLRKHNDNQIEKGVFQKVKHGEWLKKDDTTEAEFKCSVCGYSYIEADSTVECDYAYCPSCGAKMGGGNNGN